MDDKKTVGSISTNMVSGPGKSGASQKLDVWACKNSRLDMTLQRRWSPCPTFALISLSSRPSLYRISPRAIKHVSGKYPSIWILPLTAPLIKIIDQFSNINPSKYLMMLAGKYRSLPCLIKRNPHLSKAGGLMWPGSSEMRKNWPTPWLIKTPEKKKKTMFRSPKIIFWRLYHTVSPHEVVWKMIRLNWWPWTSNEHHDHAKQELKDYLPSGNLLHSYWKWPSRNSEFSHEK